MKKLMILLAVLATVGVCFSQSTFIVYDNTLIDKQTTFQIGAGEEVGDEILLDNTLMNGTLYSINYFTFTYWGNNFNGNEQMTVKFYANDGAGGKPNTVLWDSTPFAIPQTPKSQVIFDDLNVTVTQRNLTWAVQFSGLESGETAGLWIYSPPSVGQNYTDYWYNDGSGWQLRAGSQAIDFEAKVGVNPIPPTVQLTSPLDGVYAVANSSFTLSATASDPDGYIEKVEFYVDSVKVGEDTTPPYTFTWNTGSAGIKSVYAKAIDTQGVSTDSTVAALNVVSITPPNYVASPTIYPTGQKPVSIATGDFISDNLKDIAVANADSQTVTIYKNMGQGVFNSINTINLGATPKTIVSGDFNGDGKVDIAVAVTENKIIILQNSDNLGNFTQTQVNLTGEPIGLVAGKFDGDNTTDLATLLAPDKLQIIYNAGSSTIQFTVPVTESFGNLAIGDYNKDGLADIAVTDVGGAVIIMKHNNDHTFTSTGSYSIGGTSPVPVLFEDINSDTMADIITGDQTSETISVLAAQNDGTFAPIQTINLGFEPSALGLSDLDKDGYKDLLVATTAGNLVVLPGTVNGTFMYFQGNSNTLFPIGPNGQTSLAIEEFNNDSSTDVAVANSENDSLYVFLNKITPLFIVYDNTTFDRSTTFQIGSGEEVGDEVLLDNTYFNGNYYLLDYFSFTYWGQNFSGDEQMNVKFYKNDGANGAPGTQIWESGLFSIPATPKSQVIFDGGLGVTLNQRNFTWAVTFNGLTSGESAGLWIFSPPTVGQNYTDYWYNDGSGWQLRAGTQAIDFEAKFGALAVPPTVTVSSPVEGAFAVAGNDLTITANASDLDGWIQKVEFYVDGTKVGEDTVAPYSYTWTAGLPANVVIYAKAIDSQWLSTESAYVHVQIVPNSPPSFVKGPDITVAEDSGSQTFANWATSISPGPPYEANQTVTFIVQNNNNALFSVQPAISPDGTLTFTPAPNAYGSAIVGVLLKDNGGTLGGGNDTSTLESFTIAVTPVNDPPVVQNISETTPEDTLIQIQLQGSDVDGDPLTYSVVTPPAHGTVSILGSIATYTPATDYNGTDSFTYRAFDGTDYSSPATVTITITAVNDVKPSFFAPAVDYMTEETPIGIVIGDFIKDGKKDIAVACAGTNTAVIIYKGIGYGEFQQANVFPIDGTPVGIVAAEFNYDGRLDIAVTCKENKMFVLYNLDNQGNFNVTEVPLTFSPIGLVTEKFDGDNYADLACLSAEPNLLNIIYNGGTGIMQYALTNVSQVAALATADFNRDGRRDIAFVDSQNDTVGIVKQNPDRTFVQIAQYTVGSSPNCIVFTDINADYRPDIIVGNANDMSITVLLARNNATDPFVAGQTIYLGLVPSALAVADLDKDGYKDLLVATEDGLLIVLKGAANGTFNYYPGDSNTIFVIGSAGQKAIAVDELNNDSSIDAAVANSESGTFSVLLNNRTPKAFGGRFITYEDTPVEILLRGTYGPLNYLIVGEPINGTYEVKEGYSLTDTTESPVIVYTPNPDFYGNDTIMFMVDDGVKVSSLATIYIRVLPVNDQPSFDILTEEIDIDEDSPIIRIQNFAYNIDRGAPNESRQAIRFIVSNDNPDLFWRQPTINYLGELSFMPKRNAYGTATVTAYLRDSGGSNTTIGDQNTSEPRVFTININNVNDPPVISRIVGTYVVSRNTYGAFTVYVSDIETDAADLELTVTSADQSIVEDSSFTETNYGGIRVVQFTPVPDATGRVLLTFTLSDGTSTTSKSIWVLVR